MIKQEFALYESNKTRIAYLKKMYMPLKDIRPTSVESERAFSALYIALYKSAKNSVKREKLGLNDFYAPIICCVVFNWSKMLHLLKFCTIC